MKRLNIYLLLAFQQVIAGGTHIVAKAVVGDIDAATLTFLRTVIAAAGLWAIARVRSGPLKIDRGDWRQLALLGFLGVALNQFLYLYGMKYSTAANGALLYAATPVFVLVFSRLTRKEKMNPRKTFGIVMAFVGISIVIFERGIDFSSGYAFGNLLILIAVIAWTLFTVLGRQMILKYGALRTTAAMMICGAVMFYPYRLDKLFSASFLTAQRIGLGRSVIPGCRNFHPRLSAVVSCAEPHRGKQGCRLRERPTGHCYHTVTCFPRLHDHTSLCDREHSHDHCDLYHTIVLENGLP